MKVSGLDVHKDIIFCAINDGKSYSEVKEYDSTTNSIRQMGEHLKKEGVQHIAMESTSIYWIPVWDILEEMNFDLILVNPFLIKQMPGRKSNINEKKPYNPTLVHIYDPVKVERSIAYHQKEIEKASKLLPKKVV